MILLPEGTYTDFKKTIVLGHSCEDHVTELQKVLEKYDVKTDYYQDKLTW